MEYSTIDQTASYEVYSMERAMMQLAYEMATKVEYTVVETLALPEAV